MPFKLEICSFNLQSALIAQQAGAQRVELCADPEGGGTTPSLGVIKMARAKLQVQLYPIIRPRGGDFLFNDEEFDIMMNDVALCKQYGCDGAVIGMLNADGAIDKKRCAKLVELAYPLGITFHRAFDWCANPFEAMEDIIGIGCERILTSGQKPTALEGAALINELVRQADNRIVIMPGSGVRANNIVELKEKTGAEEFHTSARALVKTNMQFINENMHEDLSCVMASDN
ncbi:MAG: copper homeostasis protein CutC, partial [Bacteroidetes bacterium]|nr:copper homeostasis protein CutC [Bacteroidota bacterium]